MLIELRRLHKRGEADKSSSPLHIFQKEVYCLSSLVSGKALDIIALHGTSQGKGAGTGDFFDAEFLEKLDDRLKL